MDVTRRKLEASSWLSVVRAYQECQRRYTRLMEAFGLTTPQFDALNAIARLGDDATPKAIASELVVTRGNITGVLHRLEEAGLVETRANEADGRSFICLLTDSGTSLLHDARHAAQAFIREQLAPFSDEELVETESRMHRMQSHLTTIDPDAVVSGTAAVR
jgi:MarR family 2-MHQ and catechol resistance regulon transcriptional repressor